MVIGHIDWSTLGYDLGWSEWCHNVFSRLCMAGTQPQCLCSPIGAPSPSWPSWSQFFIFRYYLYDNNPSLLLHGNPRTSTCVQLCCSPLVWWLLPLRSAAPSSSFLVSLTGKSITVWAPMVRISIKTSDLTHLNSPQLVHHPLPHLRHPEWNPGHRRGLCSCRCFRRLVSSSCEMFKLWRWPWSSNKSLS